MTFSTHKEKKEKKGPNTGPIVSALSVYYYSYIARLADEVIAIPEEGFYLFTTTSTSETIRVVAVKEP